MANDTSEHDVYVGCHGDLAGFGGAMIAGRELAAECVKAGMSVMLLGLGDSSVATRGDGIDLLNVSVKPTPLLWRVHAWRIPALLARELRKLPAPRDAFVSFSPLWTYAAKLTWRRTPVIHRYCGLPSNCAALSPEQQEKRSFWARVAAMGSRWCERKAFLHADRILVSSREHVEEIAAFLPKVRDRNRICPDGLTLASSPTTPPDITRKQLGLREKDFLILACGSFDWNKSFEHAVRELAACDRRAHLVLIGDGPRRSVLMDSVRAAGVTDRTHILGRVDNLADWYVAADCVVSTSIYDAFPNVIKEAMYFGCPVIVPAHDPPRVYAGVSSVVSDACAGQLYNRLETGALASRINELIADSALSRELGRTAADAANRLFDWKATLREIRSVSTPTRICPTPSAAVAAEPSTNKTRTAPRGRIVQCDTRDRAKSATTSPSPDANAADNPNARVTIAACDNARERRL